MWTTWNCETCPTAIITNGLVVDANFTIYFANSNIDPIKLTKIYPNIVWVPQFAGPNSSVLVQYKGGGACIMNALVANSGVISTDYDGIPNDKKEPYILDNPNPYVGSIPCPSTINTSELVNVTNTNAPAMCNRWWFGRLGRGRPGDTAGVR
jgi:hypothetical protein